MQLQQCYLENIERLLKIEPHKIDFGRREARRLGSSRSYPPIIMKLLLEKYLSGGEKQNSKVGGYNPIRSLER